MATIWTIRGRPREYWWEKFDQRESDGSAPDATPHRFTTLEDALRDATSNGFRYGDPEHMLHYDTDH